MTPNDVLEQSVEDELKAYEAELRKELGLEDEDVNQFEKPVEHKFLRQSRETTTVLFGGLTVAHDQLIKRAVAGLGYNVAMALLTGPVALLAVQLLNAAFVAGVAGVGLTLFQRVVPRPGLASGLFMNTTRIGAILSGALIAVAGLPGLGYPSVFVASALVTAAGGGLVVLAVRVR